MNGANGSGRGACVSLAAAAAVAAAAEAAVGATPQIDALTDKLTDWDTERLGD